MRKGTGFSRTFFVFWKSSSLLGLYSLTYKKEVTNFLKERWILEISRRWMNIPPKFWTQLKTFFYSNENAYASYFASKKFWKARIGIAIKGFSWEMAAIETEHTIKGPRNSSLYVLFNNFCYVFCIFLKIISLIYQFHFFDVFCDKFLKVEALSNWG